MMRTVRNRNAPDIMPLSQDFPYEEPLATGVERIVTETLAKPDAATGLIGLYWTAVQFYNDLVDDMTRKEPPSRPIACRAGCAFCCTTPVVNVTPFEAFAIADYIATHFTGEDTARLMTRIADGDARKAAALEQGQFGVYTCPLLVDDTCSIHSARPMVCRSINSFDATTCERRLKDRIEDVEIVGYAHPFKLARATITGLRRGVARAGLDDTPLDLAPALRIALTVKDAAQRWLAREPVFAKAHARVFSFEDEP